MALYERTEGGKVVERVRTVDGTAEDNRLATAARNNKGGWREARSDKGAGKPVDDKA